MMVFSPVDSLNKATLKLEGVSVPAAKYSFVWSGQKVMEDMIPVCERFSGGKEDFADRAGREGRCSDLLSHPSFSLKELCEASSLRCFLVYGHRTLRLHLRTRSISYQAKSPRSENGSVRGYLRGRDTLWRLR